MEKPPPYCRLEAAHPPPNQPLIRHGLPPQQEHAPSQWLGLTVVNAGPASSYGSEHEVFEPYRGGASLPVGTEWVITTAKHPAPTVVPRMHAEETRVDYCDLVAINEIEHKYLHGTIDDPAERAIFHVAWSRAFEEWDPPLTKSFGRYAQGAITRAQAEVIALLPGLRGCHERYLVRLEAKIDRKRDKINKLCQEAMSMRALCRKDE